MYQPIVLCISLRYIFGRSLDFFYRFISWISIISMSMGIGALIIVLSVMNGFEYILEHDILGLTPHVLLTTKDNKLNPKDMSDKYLKTLLNGVKNITPLITHEVILQSKNNISTGIILGVNSKNQELFSHYMLNNKIDKLIDHSYKIIISEQLANQLNVKLGDKIRLIIPDINCFTPLGYIPSQRIFVVYDIYFACNTLNYQVFINQQDAANLMKYPAHYITGWQIWLQKPLEVNRINQQKIPKNLIWHDWQKYQGELFKAIHIEKNVMSIIIGLIIILSISNIFISLNLLLIEKYIDIAILKTQGLAHNKIMLIFIIRGIIAGIIASIIGVGIGIILTQKLNEIIHTFNTSLNDIFLPEHIELNQIITIVLSTIMLIIISTLYPSKYAANINPTRIIKYE